MFSSMIILFEKYEYSLLIIDLTYKISLISSNNSYIVLT